MNKPVFPFFDVGRIVATPGAMEKLSSLDMSRALSRHMSGDWGLVDGEDKAANDLSLQDGTRLLSAYALPGEPPTGEMFWIITEADRSVTTFLLPEEY
jgi:hypothetical protein